MGETYHLENNSNTTFRDLEYLEDKPSTEPFVRAIARLEEGMERYLSSTNDTQLRDGLIQRFEFTYEAAHRTLKRYLEYASPNPAEIDEMTFQDLIRTANERGLLLRDWSDWCFFRDMRSKTSHTYDDATAVQVVEVIPVFIEAVTYLRKKLQEHLS